MNILFADFYKHDITDKKFKEIKSFLKLIHLPSNKNNLDGFLDKLAQSIIKKFNIQQIDFPYYHYLPNPIYKKEEILIDVSINDKFKWIIGSDIEALSNNKDNIDILDNALKSNNHALHNIAARELFYKISDDKVDKWIIEDLFYHHCPYCQNKFLGIMANIELSADDKEKLKNLQTKIKQKLRYKQGIVKYPARALLDKLS